MISRKIETFLPFVLIAVAVAVALVFVLHPPAARSEENEDGEDAGPDNTDCGEYGVPPEEIDERGPASPIFTKLEPIVPLKDLPPMPPLFGPRPERPPEKPIEEMTPEELEMHNKIEMLKNRRFPWQKENDDTDDTEEKVTD